MTLTRSDSGPHRKRRKKPWKILKSGKRERKIVSKIETRCIGSQRMIALSDEQERARGTLKSELYGVGAGNEWSPVAA